MIGRSSNRIDQAPAPDSNSSLVRAVVSSRPEPQSSNPLTPWLANMKQEMAPALAQMFGKQHSGATKFTASGKSLDKPSEKDARRRWQTNDHLGWRKRSQESAPLHQLNLRLPLPHLQAATATGTPSYWCWSWLKAVENQIEPQPGSTAACSEGSNRPSATALRRHYRLRSFP